MTGLPAGRARAVVPAYFHPAVDPDAWERLARCASMLRLVVLNVADGPGRRPEPAFLAAVARLQRAGVAVAGYVDTGYGRRPADEAIADVERFRDWYGVTGVVFDQVASGAGQVRHYAALAERARRRGARLVAFNHGTPPARAYARHADLLGTFEGTWRSYLDADVPRWVQSRPAEQFYHLVHSVPRARLAEAYALLARRHAGAAYVTDRGGANPYDRLPAGLIDEVGR